MSAIHIGLSFHDRPMNLALHANGITQNVVFLYQLMESLGHHPFIVKGTAPENGYLEIRGEKYRCYAFQELIDKRIKMDIFLEGSVVTPQKTRYALRKLLGTRIVTVQYGHAMIHDMERLFYTSEAKDPVRLRYPDIVWASPHFESSFSYLEMLYSAEIRSCPFIWEPDFVSKPFTKADYQEKPNLQVMEPNISLMKNLMIPVAIAEKICRKNPDLFNQMLVNNSSRIGKSPYFKANILPNFPWLDGHNQKILFGGRRTFDNTLKKRDVLVTHQWGCELNYVYLEALHKNVPLVHNSPRFKEVGYYYEGFDVNAGARACEKAIADKKISDYQKKSRSFVKRFSIRNPLVQKTYKALVEEVMSLEPNLKLQPRA